MDWVYHQAMRHALLEYQAVLFLVLLVPAFLLLRRPVRRYPARLERLAAGCGGLSLLLFVALGVVNLARPGFLWHDEPNVLSVAAAYLHGEPLYHDRSGSNLYSLLYGPCTFLLYIPILRFCRQPLMAIRVAGFVINLTNIWLLYRVLRLRVSRKTAASLMPIAIAYLLLSTSHLFGVRGDPALLLCFTLGLFLVQRLASLSAALACGVVCGMAVDFKATVAPVACLLIAMLYRRCGMRAALLSAGVALMTAAAPFMLPGISFRNYLAWLALSGHQGFLRDAFVSSLLSAAFLLTGGIVLRLQMPGSSRFARIRGSKMGLQIVSLAALCGCLLAGSKNGAGPWHLWPILPFIMLWTAAAAAKCSGDDIAGKLSDVRARHLVSAIAFAATIVCLRWGYRDLRILRPFDVAFQRAQDASCEEELRSFVKRYSGRNVAMGYGRDAGDPRSAMRFELALAGEDDFLDESALVESLKAGGFMPLPLVQRMLGCRDVWLIPHGDRPFETLRVGVLPGDTTPYLFPDSVRLHFEDAHLRTAVGEDYDVWSCATDTDRSSPDADVQAALQQPA